MAVTAWFSSCLVMVLLDLGPSVLSQGRVNFNFLLKFVLFNKELNS